MSKFNPSRIYSELDKLSVNELYIEFQKIKDFIHQKIIAEQKLAEEKANELQSKADSLKQ